MLIGVPKEIKIQEHRVGLLPASVKEFTRAGHEVIVENNAGADIHATNDDYINAGAKIVDTAKDLFDKADMIIKVKEPQPQECAMLREGQVLFTYLHLAADPIQAKGLMDSGSVAIAYETVTSETGGLPLLAPMSEVAGRMGVQVGGYYMQITKGGSGRLIGGVPGVRPASVIILGGGIAGTNSAKMAVGLGANVTILEKSLDRIRYLDDLFGASATILYSTADTVEQSIREADLVIGAVLVPGAKAPKLVTKDMLSMMKPKTVVVDIAIDQGGCFETSHATTHDEPIFMVDNILHYCVANMPGAFAVSSAQALNNAILPYALDLANKGWKQALADNVHLRRGLNVCHGKITHAEVAHDLDLEFAKPECYLAA